MFPGVTQLTRHSGTYFGDSVQCENTVWLRLWCCLSVFLYRLEVQIFALNQTTQRYQKYTNPDAQRHKTRNYKHTNQVWHQTSCQKTQEMPQSYQVKCKHTKPDPSKTPNQTHTVRCYKGIKHTKMPNITKKH